MSFTQRAMLAFQDKCSGKLYSVALPIENELDLTRRAIEVLQSADIIAAEDSKVCFGGKGPA